MIRIDASSEPSMLPDLTSMLDILFIVMVFLLLIVNIPVKTLEIDVPKTEHSQPLASVSQSPITVNVLPNSPYWGIDGTTYDTFEAFTQALTQALAKNSQPLLVGADDLAPAGKMLQLLAYLKTQNIKNTHILMEEQG